LFWKYKDVSSVVAKVNEYETSIAAEYGEMVARNSKRERTTW
jgi:hypothetical protein